MAGRTAGFRAGNHDMTQFDTEPQQRAHAGCGLTVRNCHQAGPTHENRSPRLYAAGPGMVFASAVELFIGVCALATGPCFKHTST